MNDFRPNRRELIRQAVAGMAIVPLAGVAAFTAAELSSETISLLDALSVSERADVLAGTNRTDIAARLRSLIVGATPGSTIDATMLRGVFRLSGDPFEGVADAPVTLRTGRVTFAKDFNAGPLRLPSHLHWEGNGTVIRPSVPIARIPTDNAVAFGMVETHVIPGHCSGVRGERRIEALNATYTAGLSPGALIAVFGLRPDPNLRHSIRGPVTAQTTSFGFHESAEHTIEDSLVYLLVDEEVILGTSIHGRFDTATLGARGALGTQAGSHADGAVATVLLSEIYTVTSVSGTTIAIDRPLPRTFAESQFRAGSVGTRMSGAFVIDGEFDRNRPRSMFYCLATTLSSGFRAEGDISLRRGMHGGFMGYGCRDVLLDVADVSGCGRPQVELGGSILLFASARHNRLAARRVSDGYCAYVIDNKSNGVTYYGLDGPCLDNSIEIDVLDSHVLEGEISGSSGNAVMIRDADTSLGSSIIDHGDSQATTPVAAERNTVTILNQRRRRNALGNALAGNRIVANGQVQR